MWCYSCEKLYYGKKYEVVPSNIMLLWQSNDHCSQCS